MYKTKSGRSREEIREFAMALRALIGIENKPYVPIIKVLELFLVRIVKGLDYMIVEDSEMNADAMYYPEKTLIKIRQSVYDLACADDARARFTIAHEIGHCLMHSEKNVSFARNEYVPAYKNPEWQANTFAGEFLAPHDLTKGMTIEEVVEKFKVSKQVAWIQSRCK